MTEMRSVLLACLTFASTALPQSFSPPVASVAITAGIPFASGKPTGEPFRKRFTECDSHNTCDAKPLKFGCKSDPNRNTAMLRLTGDVLFFNGKMGVDADGSPLSK